MTRNRRSRPTHAFALLAALVLVSSLVLAPLFTLTVAAQATTTTTNTTNSTNQSESNHWIGGGLSGGTNLGGIGLGIGLGGGNGKYSDVCGGGMSGMVCQGVMTAVSKLVNSFFDKLLKLLQDTAEGLVRTLVKRPVPQRNGQPAFTGKPTNEPMTTAYNVWFTKAIPAALTLWAFFMLLRYAGMGLPAAATGTRASAKKQLTKGLFDGMNILASWILAAIVLHVSVGLALWFVPDGKTIITGFDTLIDHASSVGIAALIIWFAAGLIFAMAIIVFGLSVIAPLLLAPMQPVFIAISMTPRVWLFKYVAQWGDQARGWFVPAALAPLPTAIILGFGYPILNAFRGEMTGPLASFIGVPTYVLGLCVMWLFALAAPLVLFAKSRHVRPFAMAGIAAAGAMTGMKLASGSSRLSSLKDRFRSGSTTSNETSSSSSGMGTAAGRVDPIKGNSLAGDTSVSGSGSSESSGGSGASSALGGGSGATPPASAESGSQSQTATPGDASAIGAGDSSPGATAAGAERSADAGTGTTASAYTSAGSPSSSSASGTAAGGPERTMNVTTGSSDDEAISVADRGVHEVTTSEELPTGQQYKGGYERLDGLYEDALDNSHSRNFLLQRYDSLSVHDFDGPLLLKGEEDGEFYDVTTAVEEGRVPNGSATHEESQNVVQNTR